MDNINITTWKKGTCDGKLIPYKNGTIIQRIRLYFTNTLNRAWRIHKISVSVDANTRRRELAVLVTEGHR